MWHLALSWASNTSLRDKGDVGCQVAAPARCYWGLVFQMLRMPDLEVKVWQEWSKACPSGDPGHRQTIHVTLCSALAVCGTVREWYHSH